jgi:cell division protein FtsN
MGHRDLKSSPRAARARATSPRGGGGVMMGIIIGLIVGVAAVVGAVMYFSHAATPFSNMQKMERAASAAASTAQPQILEPGAAITDSSAAGLAEAPPPPVSAARPASAPVAVTAGQQKAKPSAPAAAASSKDSQRFDFYKILPGQVDAVTADKPADSSAQHSDTSAAKKPYLQLGAFQNQDDADNLKAKLALLGIEATIQSVSVPGKGMLHRVRVGPFPRQEDVDRVRAQLKQNGINTIVKLAN